MSFTVQAVLGNVLDVPTEYPTIQSALSSAQLYDTVLLAFGDYSEAVFVPALGLTVCSEFVLTGDTLDIGECKWRGVANGDDTLRAVSVEEEAGPDPRITIAGITFLGSTCLSNDEGGAIRVFRNSALVRHCRFDSCFGGYGGAIAIREANANIQHCSFNACGANRLAGALRVVQSQVWVDDCRILNSFPQHSDDEIPELLAMRNSTLRIRNTLVQNNGFGHHPSGTYLIYVSKPPDTLEIVSSDFRDNHLTNAVNWGGRYLNYLRLDSSTFQGNQLTGAIYSQGGPDSATTLQAIGNVFDGFSPVPARGMHGIFALLGSRATVTILRNLFIDFSGGHTSFGTIQDINRAPRIVAQNYIVENSNHSVSWPPSGQVLLIGNDSTDFQYNVFHDNIGYAAYQGPINAVSYARHNYWDHETGPFDSVGNPGGQGDTVEWRIQYEPWEEDTNFFSATPNPRETTGVPESFIGSAYPNPFNGQVTIEFVLLRDQGIVLDIYDLTGRHVTMVYAGRMSAGVHIRTWMPTTQASGIFFARLKGKGGVNSTTKLLYMK